MIKRAIACAAVFLTVATSTSAAAAGPVVLFYDASQAQEFGAALADNDYWWSGYAKHVRLDDVRKSRNPGRVVVRFVASDSMPAAGSIGPIRPDSPTAVIPLSRAAVGQGHYDRRVVAREYGRVWGLAPTSDGRCDRIMSGPSAGPQCKKFRWERSEVDLIDNNYR
ncbi:hypothetical protein JNUCC0626_13640 [Lentzea sp. JNUCC 0626]|uniref:hypothetical protein n=1 Tax=Lentzea sp. JNUCC 0626 TaxID=3367513 RepID=UPI0037488F2E